MIIDCHAHVIQNWIGACGHPTRNVHAKYLQRMLAHTVARTFRARDRAPSDTKALLDTHDPSWNGLNDVDFRVGRFGQLEFTVEGEDYYVQYMPVGMQNQEAPPEAMLAQMAYIGVDHAVLQAGGAYGAMTDYNAFSQQQYPNRFTGLMHVDEALAGTPEKLEEIRRGIALGLKGIYYNVDSFARHGFPWPLDDERLDPFWDILGGNRLVLCLELTSGPSYDVAGYVSNLRALDRALDRHPGIRCHLAMGPPVGFFAQDGRWNFPVEVASVYRREDFYLEIMFPITWGGRWDYPYSESRPLIEGMRDQFGADRLLWGSDMPNVERFCTYAQSLDYLRRYCTFLSPHELDLILGKNTALLYDIAPVE